MNIHYEIEQLLKKAFLEDDIPRDRELSDAILLLARTLYEQSDDLYYVKHQIENILQEDKEG